MLLLTLLMHILYMSCSVYFIRTNVVRVCVVVTVQRSGKLQLSFHLYLLV